ncbi:hypothetical protein DPEC_G00159540 [Dallia pectoralis]|uniref:Uncharacterized protein n=1 Tax=Dallia pectoralis TaxID=75939 RepID=A0ACC2GFT4_DALPE|nr:hypothetical protein DPEC_G00159540 [Dallia pectoralis]
MEEVRVLCRANATSLAALGIDVESMCTHNQRVLTVHTYSAFVSDETLVHYLSRYTTVMPGVKRIPDALGIWTGKRQFNILLKEDKSSHDGYLHPPASFSIGRDKGYLLYAGQPRYCRKCNSYGHLADTCTQTRCRNCNTIGHVMRDCTVPKRCNLCGSEEHLFRHCPKNVPSYANAVRGKTNEEDIQKLRDIEVVVRELERERDQRDVEETVEAPMSSSREGCNDRGKNFSEQVEQVTEAPTPILEPVAWTKVGERRKATVKRKIRSPVTAA